MTTEKQHHTGNKANALRKDLPPLPKRMLGRPVDHRGFPVPWFVAFLNGEPDFRVIRPNGIAIAVSGRNCWICGERLGRHLAFVIGPMCAINRITSEPPSHLECAMFAVQACPFMLRPRMKRNEHNLPELYKKPAGIHLDRNPGVMCLWMTRTYSMFRATGGVLLEVGEPESVSWWTEGRAATRAEVEVSIAGGYPELQALAEKDGPEAVIALKRKMEIALALLPKGDSHVPYQSGDCVDSGGRLDVAGEQLHSDGRQDKADSERGGGDRGCSMAS